MFFFQVLIQAQIKNITERHTSLLLEDVTFLADDGLISEPLSVAGGGGKADDQDPSLPSLSPLRMRAGRRTSTQDDEEEEEDRSDDLCDCLQAFDRHVYLQPDGITQYIYRVKRLSSNSDGSEPYSKAPSIAISPGMSLGYVMM